MGILFKYSVRLKLEQLTEKFTRRQFLIGLGTAFAGVFGFNLYYLSSKNNIPEYGSLNINKHRRDGNCIDKLVKLVPPPKYPMNATEEVLNAKEKELGIKFPPDYRELFLTYGVGCFMFKPDEGEYYLDVFDIVDPKGNFDCMERTKFFDDGRKSFLKHGVRPKLPYGYKLLGKDPGLIPFGFIDGDMEWFFWLTKGSPSQWQIAVDAGRNGVGDAELYDMTTACLILEIVENGVQANHLQRDKQPVKFRRGRDRWWRGEALWETGYVGSTPGVASLWLGTLNSESEFDKYVDCKKDKDKHIVPNQPNQFMKEFGINWYDNDPQGHQYVYERDEKPVDDGFFEFTLLKKSSKAISESAHKKKIDKANSAIIIHNWDYERMNFTAKERTKMKFIGVFPCEDLGTIYGNRGPFFYNQKLDENK